MSTNKMPSQSLSQLGVLLPGAVGLLVIVRALGVYLGHDAVASLIMMLMGVGLCTGLIELFLRQRTAQLLGREIAGLPLQPSEADVEKASPALRAFLRARIEHLPTSMRNENLTPYLAGLMVMLGLLGTLLGLFETLHGAGQALTASTDVDALRTGLSGPMSGLTRSFGCSAAGVSASAMLGLASVFVRRAEAAVWSRAQAYAMGPLRELSPLRRQFNAFSQIAQQGEALPRAATALEQAIVHLGGLAERWEAAHKAASELQQKAAVEMVERLRGELARSTLDAGKALSESVAPLLKQVVTQTGDVASQQMKKTLEALDRDLAVRREADEALRSGIREQLTQLRSSVEQEARTRLSESEARLMAVEQELRERATQQAELLQLTREQAHQHVASLESAARALTTQLDEEARARREESSRLLGDLAARLDQAARERAQESRDELSAISALGSKLISESEAREQALVSRWQALSGALDARSVEVREQDAARLVALRAELEAQNAALAESWRSLAQRVEDATSATRAEEEARIARLDDVARRIGEDLTGLAQALGQDLNLRAERERSVAERTEKSLQAMEQSAKGLHEALERQDLAVQVLVERGSEQLAQMGVQAQQGAREALERIVQIGNEQAERFTQLETLLQSSAAQNTRSLGDELSAHAERLSKGLEATTQLVHEAGTVLKASSVEMGAVAEMFQKSVDRQREAANAWMESLGELEGAVERAGRGAAADALGDQLASTQEVFARQLQFQRELFEQLRTLRGAPAASSSAHGEADVSA